MKTIITLFFLLCISGVPFSQEPQDPIKAIQELKDGVLVVRLRTQSNKISKLEEAIASGNLKENTRLSFEAELAETRMEVARENRLLRQAFKDLYRFSDVLFLHDTLAPTLKLENPGDIFLNEAGAMDPELALEGPFFIAGIGLVMASEGASGNEALIVYNRDFNAMEKPFPGYSGVSTIRLLFRSFTSSSEKIEAFQFRTMVERMNRKLFRFYARNEEYITK